MSGEVIPWEKFIDRRGYKPGNNPAIVNVRIMSINARPFFQKSEWALIDTTQTALAEGFFARFVRTCDAAKLNGRGVNFLKVSPYPGPGWWSIRYPRLHHFAGTPEHEYLHHEEYGPPIEDVFGRVVAAIRAFPGFDRDRL